MEYTVENHKLFVEIDLVTVVSVVPVNSCIDSINLIDGSMIYVPNYIGSTIKQEIINRTLTPTQGIAEDVN